MTDTEVLQTVAGYLRARLVENAPVRTNPLGKTKYSPFPGNLRQNGITVAQIHGRTATIIVGGAAAPYGLLTETKSHKPGWMGKSLQQTASMVCSRYGGARR